MKAILEFTLPPDEIELRHALAGHEAHYALREIDEKLRATVKYSDAPGPVKDYAAELRTFIFEMCRDNNINLEDA